jgi:hypothetical protein
MDLLFLKQTGATGRTCDSWTARPVVLLDPGHLPIYLFIELYQEVPVVIETSRKKSSHLLGCFEVLCSLASWVRMVDCNCKSMIHFRCLL